jgi:hypothetical protein
VASKKTSHSPLNIPGSSRHFARQVSCLLPLPLDIVIPSRNARHYASPQREVNKIKPIMYARPCQSGVLVSKRSVSCSGEPERKTGRKHTFFNRKKRLLQPADLRRPHDVRGR